MVLYGPLTVLLLLGVGMLGYVVGRSSVRQSPLDPAVLAAARQETARLRALVNRVKDIAWDQREVDPALSTIIIEEIREHERRELDP